MKGFRIIGVNVLKDCSTAIRKSLKEETFYQIDQRFSITSDQYDKGKIIDVNFEKGHICKSRQG